MPYPDLVVRRTAPCIGIFLLYICGLLLQFYTALAGFTALVIYLLQQIDKCPTSSGQSPDIFFAVSREPIINLPRLRCGFHLWEENLGQ